MQIKAARATRPARDPRSLDTTASALDNSLPEMSRRLQGVAGRQENVTQWVANSGLPLQIIDRLGGQRGDSLRMASPQWASIRI